MQVNSISLKKLSSDLQISPLKSPSIPESIIHGVATASLASLPPSPLLGKVQPCQPESKGFGRFFGGAFWVEKLFVPRKAIAESSNAALARLQLLPGGADLSQLITEIAPVISHTFRTKILEKGESYKPLCDDLILCMLRSVAANIGASILKNRPEGMDIRSITLVDMVEYLFKSVQGEFAGAQQAVLFADRMTDGVAKQKHIDGAIAPVIDKLISICLAGGKEELKFMRLFKSLGWGFIHSKLSNGLAKTLRGLRNFDCMNPQETLVLQTAKLEQLVGPGLVFDKVTKVTDLFSRHIVSFFQKNVIEEGSKLVPKIGDCESALWSKEDPYLLALVKSSTMQIVVQAFEAGKGDQKGVVNQLVERFGSVLQEYLKEHQEKLRSIVAINDPIPRMKAFEEAFKPLSVKIFQAMKTGSRTGSSMLSLILPLPSSLFEGFLETIEKNYFPKFLAEAISPMIGWIGDAQHHRDNITERSKNTYVSEGCRLLAEWVTDFVPTFMRKDRSDCSFNMISALKDAPFFDFLKPFIAEHESLIGKLLSEEILEISETNASLIHSVLKMLEPYLESGFLKIFDNMMKAIDQKEKSESDFLLRLGMNLLSTITAHFETLNDAVGKKSGIYDLSIAEALKGFEAGNVSLPNGITEHSLKARRESKEAMKALNKERQRLEVLTRGNEIQRYLEEIADLKRRLSQMSLDQPSYEVIQKEYRNRIASLENGCEKLKQKVARCNPNLIMQSRKLIESYEKKLREALNEEKNENIHFYQEFKKSLLSLGMNGDHLPLPSQQFLAAMMENKFIPTVFKGVFEAALRPDNLNKMLINGLEGVTRVLDALDAEDEMQIQLRIAQESLEVLSGLKKEERYLEATPTIKLKNAYFREQSDISNAVDSLEKAVSAIKAWEKQAKDPRIHERFTTMEANLQMIKKSFSVVFGSIKSISDTPSEWKDRFRMLSAFVPHVNSLKADLSAILDLIKEEEKLTQSDEMQKHLDEQSGRLILQMARLIPQSLMNVFFKSAKITNPSSRLVGRALRKLLSKKMTFMTMIEKGFEIGMPKLMDGGKWVGEGRDMRFERSAPLDVDPNAPPVSDEVAKFRLMEEQEARVKVLKELMLVVVRRSFAEIFRLPMRKLKQAWRSLVNWMFHQLGIFIDFVFGSSAPKIRRWGANIVKRYNELRLWIDKMVEKFKDNAFYKVISNMIHLPIKWFIEVLMFFPNLHFKSKINQFMKSVPLDLHQVLLFKLMHQVINLETFPMFDNESDSL